MQRKQKLNIILLLGLLLVATGCQTTRSFPFVTRSAGLPAQSE